MCLPPARLAPAPVTIGSVTERAHQGLHVTNDRVDGTAGEVGSFLTLDQAADLLGKSEKTVRRYIRAGKLDKGAVHREKTPGGFRYLIAREAVEGLDIESRQTHVDGDLERIGRKLDTCLGDMAARIEEALRPVEGLAKALPEAQQEREELRRAVADLTQAVQQQASEIAELRR